MTSNKTILRIINDYVDFNNNKPDGMYLWIDKKNIYQQYALIIGSQNTPYFGGFFIFDIKYPEDYPIKPPTLKLITNNNDIRFNPNLYENGRVCLSILGTWHGPSWKPIMNIRLVLNSIVSLMSEFPIQNEPGWEKTKITDKASIEYNIYLTYYTYNLAIVEVLNGKYKTISSLFEKEIKEEFNKNLRKLDDDLLSYKEIYGRMPIEKMIYFVRPHIIDFNELYNKFVVVKNQNNS